MPVEDSTLEPDQLKRRLDAIHELILSDQVEGLAQLDQLLAAIEDSGRVLDFEEACRVAACLGTGQRMDEAVERLEALLAGCEDQPPVRIAHAWQLLGSVRYRQARYDETCEAGARCRELLEGVDSQEAARIRCNSLVNEGIARKNLGDAPRAVELLREAFERLSSLGLTAEAASAEVNLACAYEDVGDLERALEHYLGARRLLDGEGSLRQELILNFNLAVLYTRLNRTEEARAHGELTLELQEKVQLAGFDTAAFALLAETCLRLEDEPAALRYARAITDQADAQIHPANRANQLGCAALVLHRLGLHTESRETFDRALASVPEGDPLEHGLRIELRRVQLEVDAGGAREAYDALPRLFERVTEKTTRRNRLLLLETATLVAEAVEDYPEALRFERERVDLILEEERERSDGRLASLQALYKLEEERARSRDLEASRLELERRVDEEISVRLAAEEERESLREGLRRSQRLEALGRLASGMAHDFNNLLTVFQGVGFHLENQAPGGQNLERLAAQVDATVARGAAITRRLLAFGGQVSLEPRDVPCGELLGGVQFLLERLLGADIELRVAALGSGRLVRVDPAQLDSVLMNLAINARDAMPAGGRLEISTRIVEEDGVEVCRILVSDSGTGIPEPEREAIFEPFFTTKPLERGTGLGLSTSLGIVSEMGGRLELVESSEQGSVFGIWLPLARGQHAESPAASVPSGPPRLRGLSAHVVEDDEDVRTVLTAMLAELGAVPHAFGDGEEALRHFESGGPPDLYVCDIDMPRASGVELVHRLREDGASVPILLISGWHGRLPRDLEEPGVAFLKKPVSLDTLARSLELLLATADGGGASGEAAPEGDQQPRRP